MAVHRVGTCGDYPPLTKRRPDGAFEGLAVELVERCFGVGRVEWVATTWPALHDGLSAGKYDAAFGGINETAARRARFDVSAAVLPCAKCILTQRGNEATYDGVGAIDKPGVTVVTNPGGTNALFCQKNFKHARVLKAADNVAPFQHLAARTADVMITDSIEALHRENVTAASPTPLAAVRAERPLTDGHTVALARKGCARGAAFLNAFNEYLASPRGARDLRELTTKWLGRPVQRPAAKL
eukprot:TRINITY_DN7451_c0_g1_i1.p1 TRINITY_DN7451_c0_g1~~TRINITY_DN7451_c0_g1_i1.p1  ORF type:complete len:257 (+),score=74.75 TRINITY_DN7451_c0_g1_i1:49-771(+)